MVCTEHFLLCTLCFAKSMSLASAALLSDFTNLLLLLLVQLGAHTALVAHCTDCSGQRWR